MLNSYSWSAAVGVESCVVRSLTIVDVYTREAVAIEAGQSLKGRTPSEFTRERG